MKYGALAATVFGVIAAMIVASAHTARILLAIIAAGSVAVVAAAEPADPAPPKPTIYSIEPASGAAGARVALIGFGFSTKNTVHFGGHIILDVPIAWAAGITCVQGDSRCHPGINQALMITVPAAAKVGRYDVFVEAANGASNVVTFVLNSAP
jgi:hypothetical protein